MEKNNLITEQLNEKVYSVDSGNSKENITEILYYFLTKLLKENNPLMVD